MLRPDSGSRLTGPIGNNAFAYEQRKNLDPDPKVRIPEMKEISSISDIKLGTLPTFAELDEAGNVVTYTGLEYIYCTDAISCVPTDTVSIDAFSKNTIPTYIFDNHNYALYFWGTHTPQGLPVIHIDQHADLAKPPNGLDKNYDHAQLSLFTTQSCNVGNFIIPARDAGIISECIWIKNEYTLDHPVPFVDTILTGKTTNLPPYILDIDLDFWAPEMDIDLLSTLPKVINLMRHASLITIATSPYFLDQHLAITLLQKIFSYSHKTGAD